MYTFVNLFVVIGIIAAIIAIKMRISWWNWLLALISTIIIILGSMLIYTPSMGYGSSLMITIPGSPVAFLVLWFLFFISDLIGRGKAKS